MFTVYKGNLGHGCHRKIVAIWCHHGWGPLQRTFSIKETEVSNKLSFDIQLQVNLPCPDTETDLMAGKNALLGG